MQKQQHSNIPVTFETKESRTPDAHDPPIKRVTTVLLQTSFLRQTLYTTLRK